MSAPTVLINSKPGSLTAYQKKKLSETTDAVMDSNFEIFGNKVPGFEKCAFNADWRFNKKWSAQYYKRYKFYDKKDTPYDVKFPWEFSRLHYFVPVLASQWTGKTDYVTISRILLVLKRWREENPLAYSVNWYPMEASMRVISLVMMLDFVRLLIKKENHNCIELNNLGKQLLIMLEEHGTFIWANIEFTDVRGNHFTANIVALLLASCALEGKKRKLRWKRYALKWLDKEVLLQFCKDGVNFEKACGYHKLVLELFLLAAIVRERMGEPFGKVEKSILSKAVLFSDAVMRPDGVAANFGDNDNAIALPFVIDNPRSHGLVVELARAFFNRELGSFTFDEKEKLASLFILGFSRPNPKKNEGTEIINFPDGGYLIVRRQTTGFFFMVDIGEVGMSGRGGHGHNDLLGFELCVAGQPIIIDPGCPCYTADLIKKNKYRSTVSHATVELFGEEIARLSGYWFICNDAEPVEASVSEKNGTVIIHAGHNGYERIAQGTRVFRTFEVNPQNETLIITDEIKLTIDNVKSSWRFPVGTSSVIKKTPHIFKIENGHAGIIMSTDLVLDVQKAFYSVGYGVEEEGKTIKVSTISNKGVNRHIFKFEGIRL